MIRALVYLLVLVGCFVSLMVWIFRAPEDSDEVFDAEGLHGPKDR